MHRKQLCQSNIDNLTSFWKLLGAERYELNESAIIYASVDWPNRIWLDWEHLPSSEGIAALLAKTKQVPQAIVPVWRETNNKLTTTLYENGFKVLFRQTAMTLLLENEFEHRPKNLSFIEVSTSEEVIIWTHVAAESFGYYIPASSIRNIIGLPNLKLILAFREHVPVATGLLFENKGVVGIHMVGVLPTHRRLGIARELMYYLIMTARKSNIAYATLQASAMGKPLYEALGFESQFTITNFCNFENRM